MNIEDVLDCLFETTEALERVGHIIPEVKDIQDFKIIQRNVHWCIGSLRSNNPKYMTPKEAAEFRKNLEQLRNGGA